jgi:type IV pilus assembly protein PilM
MANRVLSIEIGSVITRVAEMEYKTKNPRIYQVFTFATPPNMLADGNVTVSDIFVSQLRSNLSDRRITTKHAIFIINSNRVANRTIQIPFVKENRVADLLKANASDYFPVDLSQYELSHEVLGPVMDGTEKKLQVAVVAVPKDMIDSYETLANACGLTLSGLDYMGNAIKKLMVREIPEEIKVTMKVNEDSTVVTIIENDVIQLQRTVNYGISDAITSVQESGLFGEHIDANEALRILKRKTCVFKKFDQKNMNADDDADRDGDVSPAEMGQLRAEITDDLRVMVGSIARVFDYYQSRNASKKIEKVYLAGIGSSVSGLSKLLTSELGFKVVAVQQFEDMGMSKTMENENVRVAEYFGCIGAALEPVSISLGDKRGEKGVRKETTHKDSFLAPVLVCIAGVLIAVVLIFFSTMRYLSEKNTNAKLKSSIASLQEAQEIYDEYTSTMAALQDIELMMAITETPNDVFLDFLEELEQNLPSDTIIHDLSASSEGVTLSVTVSSKESAAKVLAQLRSFASIYDEGTSSISQETDDSGKITVNFSLTTTYNAPVSDIQAAEESSETTDETTEE